jgi:hypothetical protein
MSDVETLDEMPVHSNKLNEDDLDEYESENSDDLPSMCVDLIRNIPVKQSFFIFILGIFIFSDIFIEHILVNFSNSVVADMTTSKGTGLQLLFLIMGYIIVDLLIKGNYL